MMHDFAVTQKHVAPDRHPDGRQPAADAGRAASTSPTIRPCRCTWACMRRGGDGKDVRWFKGANLFCTHVMGAWSRRRQDHARHGRRRGQPVPVLPQRARAVRPGEGARAHPPLHHRPDAARATTATRSRRSIPRSPACSRGRTTASTRCPTARASSTPGAGWAIFDHAEARPRSWSPCPTTRCRR